MQRMYRADVCSSVAESALRLARNVDDTVDFFFDSDSAEIGKSASTSLDEEVPISIARSGCRKPRFLSSHASAVYVTLPA